MAAIVDRVALMQRTILGLYDLRGLVTESKAYTQRALELYQRMDMVTTVPCTCILRHEVETWGQRQQCLPLLLEKPGKHLSDAPRRWYGCSVTRQVEVEDGED